MKVAVVGVTGMVGQVMLDVLEERDFPVDRLIPVASERSVGKEIQFKGEALEVVSMKEAVREAPKFALFSAGGDVSLEWAPEFAEKGTVVIDNSSAYRMDGSKKLIVPEINGDSLTGDDKIIANPNCSTTQLVMALKPLHDRYQINRVVVSTYQSITGSGVKAVRQLANEEAGEKGKMAYPYQIHRNALPHCGDFQDNDYTKEEMKLPNETQKILGDDAVLVTATAVRIPVLGGHSEAVNLEFENEFNINDVKRSIRDFPGLTLQDNPQVHSYPMPSFAEGKDDVFVGRIRRDLTRDKALNLWIVSDNLRKGAATNAVGIAEYLIKKEKDAAFVRVDLKR